MDTLWVVPPRSPGRRARVKLSEGAAGERVWQQQRRRPVNMEGVTSRPSSPNRGYGANMLMMTSQEY